MTPGYKVFNIDELFEVTKKIIENNFDDVQKDVREKILEKVMDKDFKDIYQILEEGIL